MNHPPQSPYKKNTRSPKIIQSPTTSPSANMFNSDNIGSPWGHHDNSQRMKLPSLPISKILNSKMTLSSANSPRTKAVIQKDFGVLNSDRI